MKFCNQDRSSIILIMSNFVVRRYQSSDKEAVKKLYELASIKSEIGYRSGPWEQDFEDIERIYLNGGEFFVGLLNNDIIAMGGHRKVTDTIGHIRRMRVHPDHRRKGYAAKILQKLEKSAKRNGMIELRLRTSTQQKMAQNFYEKYGFKKMKAKKEYYTEGGGNSFEVIWYGKDLK